MTKYSGWLPLTKRMIGKTRAIGKHAAGIIVGGKVPIVVTSRADCAASRLASIAAAIIAAQ